nr:MAG TPA: hypothetical protein [Caudoviricetes sp.]
MKHEIKIRVSKDALLFCPGAWRKTVLICPCDVKKEELRHES